MGLQPQDPAPRWRPHQLFKRCKVTPQGAATPPSEPEEPPAQRGAHQVLVTGKTKRILTRTAAGTVKIVVSYKVKLAVLL